jgi:hypothetical protein
MGLVLDAEVDRIAAQSEFVAEQQPALPCVSHSRWMVDR